MSKNRYNGILLLNKPKGITSHDAVDRIRNIFGQRTVGHTGTLDPLADGLLVICLGKATKISRYLTDCDKSYDATIELGLTSTTLDAEGLDPDQIRSNVPEMTNEQLKTLLTEFVGQQLQQVPVYSAVKVDGERLYKLARKGQETDRPSRDITIHSIELTKFEQTEIKISVSCSKGTYIRTLAADIGDKIGCGAYLSGLTRTMVGRFDLSVAHTIEQLEASTDESILENKLLSVNESLDFAALLVDERVSTLVRNGVALTGSVIQDVDGIFLAGENILIKDQNGSVLAVGTADVDSKTVCPTLQDKIFNYERVIA